VAVMTITDPTIYRLQPNNVVPNFVATAA